MFTPSDKCPRRDACVQNGRGLIHMKDLTDKEGLYNHGRLFAHVTVDPGCSIGDHPHDHETEFYYIIKGRGRVQRQWQGDRGPPRRHLRHRLRRGPRPGEPGHGTRGADCFNRGRIKPDPSGPRGRFSCPEKNFPSLKVFPRRIVS